MYLITSATYIDSELQSEFGPLPPSFLPVGNRRLFLRQFKTIPQNESITLTLPAGFAIGKFDRAQLEQANINLLCLPPQLKLGEAIVYALNLMEFDDNEALKILHGDTLLDALPDGEDLIGISQVMDNYNWAEYDRSSGLMGNYSAAGAEQPSWVANGFFSFAQPRKLIKNIIQADWQFINGINRYHEEVGLKPHIFENWFDFGHNHTYYSSKSLITTQRAFNEMRIEHGVVSKKSNKKAKLAGEAHWYEQLPNRLRLYIPQLLNKKDSDEQFEYDIEYLHLTALNELFVFSELPAIVWHGILNACFRFIDDAYQYTPDNAENSDLMASLFVKKTQQRLQQFADASGFNIGQPLSFNGKKQLSVQSLLNESQQQLPDIDNHIQVMHGDFCFSNILFDFRSNTIKTIDPRGIDENDQLTIYGHRYYDIAKLAHSVSGLYDFIISGYFSAQHENNRLTLDLPASDRIHQIEQIFYQKAAEKFDLTEAQIIAMQIQLFLSMLPLHSDRPDRQLAFIGNAYRLYDRIQDL